MYRKTEFLMCKWIHLLRFGCVFGVHPARFKNEFTHNKENDCNNMTCKVDRTPIFEGEVNTQQQKHNCHVSKRLHFEEPQENIPSLRFLQQNKN